MRPDSESARDDACERSHTNRNEAVDRADPRVMHPQMAEEKLENERDLESKGVRDAAPRRRCKDEPERPGGDEGNAESAVRVVARRAERARTGQKELTGHTEKREPRDRAVQA